MDPIVTLGSLAHLVGPVEQCPGQITVFSLLFIFWHMSWFMVRVNQVWKKNFKLNGTRHTLFFLMRPMPTKHDAIYGCS